MRSNRVLREDRDEQIVATYLNDTQVTLSYLSHRFGLSRKMIQKVLLAAGVALRPEQTGRPSLLRLKPLSKGHIWLGHQIDIHLTKCHSMQEMAQQVKMSNHKLGLARYGAHDFTLSELQSLSTVLDLRMPKELLEGDYVYQEVGACN